MSLTLAKLQSTQVDGQVAIAMQRQRHRPRDRDNVEVVDRTCERQSIRRRHAPDSRPLVCVDDVVVLPVTHKSCPCIDSPAMACASDRPARFTYLPNSSISQGTSIGKTYYFLLSRLSGGEHAPHYLSNSLALSMGICRWVGFGATISCVEFGGRSLSTGPDSSDQGSQPVYSIGAVARMLDIPASTIRAWEERYEVVRPGRSEGSQRVYSRNQVEQLRFIKAKMEVGVSAADAHRLLSQELEAGRLPVAVRQPRTGVPPLILLAERDPYAADLAEYFLRTEGYDVCVALDATQATLLFQERSPNLVIIDLLISGGAGFRLCREFAAAAGAQVLAVASIDSTSEALSSGAAAFLHKPLRPLKLVSTVRDLLGTSALVRAQRYARDLR